MGYELTSAQKAPVIDENGNPVPTASISAVGGGAPPFVDSIATLQDDGTGNLELVANSPGTVLFGLVQTSTGGTAEHVITVDAPPFDWSLGTPVPK